MRLCCAFLAILMLSSCIPLKSAPSIKTEKVMKVKRFKIDNPNKYGLVFEKPDSPYDFYRFVNFKYDLIHPSDENPVPVVIRDKSYFLSIYERYKIERTLNLGVIFLDAYLEVEHDVDLLDDSTYTSAWEKGYMVITVSDRAFKDCLAPEHPDRALVIAYLRALRLQHSNLNEAMWLAIQRDNLPPLQPIIHEAQVPAIKLRFTYPPFKH